MQSFTQLGTFETLLENADPKIATIATQVRQLIQKLHPYTVEVPRTKEKTATYGFGTKKMSEAYAFISVHKKHVNLGFYHATKLDDPHALLEGTGASIRHVKLLDLADVVNPAITNLVNHAMTERKDSLNL
ncbi:MAG: DUF1801 domain-containing protein [Aggregatilineales bacterium]